MTQCESYHALVTDLERLADGELHAIIARAQSVLLDRPDTLNSTPVFTVEVVTREESRLLAYYRAFPQRAQRHLFQFLGDARRDTAGIALEI